MISCLIIAVVATFFAFKSQTISQEQVLNTLSEISSQSVNVIDKEIQKNVAVLANLSIYINWLPWLRCRRVTRVGYQRAR